MAQAFGVSEAAFSQWLASPGVEGWRAQPRGHKPWKLTEEQVRQIPNLLSHGAEACGFRRQAWNFAQVAMILRAEFGVLYHKAHNARLLKAWNWTPQLPLERASQRAEEAIGQ